MDKLDNLTIGELKEILEFAGGKKESAKPHPMLGKRVVVRTYSAGVHIGTLKEANGHECMLVDSLRLYNWSGALSLSKVASHGIEGGRTQKTGDVYLTNAIEYIPTTEKAEKTYVEFIEE